MYKLPAPMRILKHLNPREIAGHMLNVECGRELFIAGEFQDGVCGASADKPPGFPAVRESDIEAYWCGERSDVDDPTGDPTGDPADYRVYGTGGFIVCDTYDAVLSDIREILREFEQLLESRGITPHGMLGKNTAGVLYQQCDDFTTRAIVYDTSFDDASNDTEYQWNYGRSAGRHDHGSRSQWDYGRYRWEFITLREMPVKFAATTMLELFCSLVVDIDDRFDSNCVHKLAKFESSAGIYYNPRHVELSVDSRRKRPVGYENDPAFTAITHMRVSAFDDYEPSDAISNHANCDKCACALWGHCYVINNYYDRDSTVCECCVRAAYEYDMITRHAHQISRKDAIRNCDHLSDEMKDLLFEFDRANKHIVRRNASGRVSFLVIGSNYVAVIDANNILYTDVWRDPLIAGRKIIRLL